MLLLANFDLFVKRLLDKAFRKWERQVGEKCGFSPRSWVTSEQDLVFFSNIKKEQIVGLS